MDSPSSSLSGRLGLHHGSARMHCSNGGSIKKMVWWLMDGECSNVRVLVYVSFPFVRSDYVISAGVGFRVVSGVVASP